jgi:hypothetical protein
MGGKMQVISGVNNSAFFAQSAYSASTASYDVNGYPITSYLPESGVGYNAVNEISGINGSAIAQYGHEAQWLVHDDTLVHASNSAQYALGVNLSAVAQLLGVDETVLWEGTPTSTITSIQLSEPWSGFKRVKLFGKSEGGGVLYSEFDTNRTNTNINLSNGGFSDWNSNNFFVNVTIPCHFNSSDTISVNSARYVGYWSNSWQAKTVAPNTANIITKVVGVGRKS